MKKYLSFDIECCDGVHMCEFGYVVFDSDFSLLDKSDILINPEHEFRLTGRPHEDDLHLHFSEDEYKSAPIFSDVYEKIKDIILNHEYTIIGFSMSNDSAFLATACERYGKEPISFEYYDFQRMYKGYSRSKHRPSVERFVTELGIEGITLHKSDDDACAVMLGLQAIAKKENKGIEDTICYLQKLAGAFSRELALGRIESQKQRMLNGSNKAQKEYLNHYLYRLDGKYPPSSSNRVRVCIGENFQKYFFNEFLALLELIYKGGGEYIRKASECDIFVQYDYFIESELQPDKRLESVRNAVESNGKVIRIIALAEYLHELGTSMEKLKERDVLRDKPEKKNNGSRHSSVYRSGGEVKTTIGDILKAQGIDLSSFTSVDNNE